MLKSHFLISHNKLKVELAEYKEDNVKLAEQLQQASGDGWSEQLEYSRSQINMLLNIIGSEEVRNLVGKAFDLHVLLCDEQQRYGRLKEQVEKTKHSYYADRSSGAKEVWERAKEDLRIFEGHFGVFIKRNKQKGTWSH